ncbi:hypothetical protein LPJGGPFB_05641 [Ensifer adhaerens]|uniref:hypothetical protein n=1 Tax=Ensifer adhaerens TaxID=106592 RepID=UPI001569B860|nr:hypothetical protein [Ensifer adhaerens]NRP22382.1 hypothetical protein [Ensifer adhaerens]
MKLIIAAALVAVAPVPAFSAPASANSDYACREAASENLQPTVSSADRNRIVRACKAAFADKNYWKSPEAACQRQAKKFSDKGLSFTVDYICMSAALLASGEQ